MLATHSGACDLCGRDKPGGMGDWHIDHNEKTGVVRGVLCARCNMTLGKVENIGLDNILRYLRRDGGTAMKAELSPTITEGAIDGKNQVGKCTFDIPATV